MVETVDNPEPYYDWRIKEMTQLTADIPAADPRKG